MAVGESKGLMVIGLERLATPEAVYAAVLRTGEFPLRHEDARALAGMLESWLFVCAERFQLQPAMWLQGAGMYREETIAVLTDHAREWMPELGLGIRPRGEPPRMLNQNDLNKLRWDEMPRLKHESLFLLMGGARAAKSALPQLSGSGIVLCGLLDGPTEAYLDEQRALWLPTIHDPAFRAHSFYVPLFDQKCLEESMPSEVLTWLGRCVVYVRESPEDQGMLVLSSRPDAIDLLDDEIRLLQRNLGSFAQETR